MNAAGRLALFGAGLAVLFGSAAALGSAVGPDGMPGAEVAGHDGSGAHATAIPHGDDHARTAVPAEAPLPGGLQSADQGYRLVLDHDTVDASTRAPLSFRVIGPDDRPVTSYTKAHDKDLHLIMVRRDLAGFQHVHPALAADGTWSIPVDLSQPGEWRVFADFDPAGPVEGLTLGTDLSVAGDYQPRPLPPVLDVATVDGYAVAIEGTLVPGKESALELTVRKGGREVSDLQPYLAAYGHLVALRDGDLAYVHVHAQGAPGDGATKAGPRLSFHTTAPSAGAYRLFLDFKHDGVVRTAEFTITAGKAVTHGH